MCDENVFIRNENAYKLDRTNLLPIKYIMLTNPFNENVFLRKMLDKGGRGGYTWTGPYICTTINMYLWFYYGQDRNFL
jgi:hypothetical protein